MTTWTREFTNFAINYLGKNEKFAKPYYPAVYEGHRKSLFLIFEVIGKSRDTVPTYTDFVYPAIDSFSNCFGEIVSRKTLFYMASECKYDTQFQILKRVRKNVWKHYFFINLKTYV